MSEMTTSEYVAFLTEGVRTAKLATCRADGRPHVVPVWFVLDGDDLLITTSKRSVTGRALLRDPRVAACIEDDRPPFAFAMIEGRARTSDDAAAVMQAALRNAIRYVGPERATEYARINGGGGMMLVRITPDLIVSENDVTAIDAEHPVAARHR
jgi:PPOX class probable F420-dependent enzyme